MNTPRRTAGLLCASAMLATGVAQADTLLLETFNGAFGPHAPYQERGGVPIIGPDENLNTADGADNDWYGARFGVGNPGVAIPADLAIQSIGSLSNPTPVARVEDNAGILIGVSTAGYEDIQVSFDWRMFLADTTDELVFGYFVGSLLDEVLPSQFVEDLRSIDLRDTGGNLANWNDDWTEHARLSGNSTFTAATFSLPDIAVADQEEVWFAFWLDDGEGDYAKLDNILITGNLIVPVPAALPLLISGLLGFVLLRRRVGAPALA